MAEYLFDDGLNKIEGTNKEDHDALDDRVDALESNDTIQDGRLTNLEKVRIITGTENNVSVGANSSTDITLTFDPAFAKAPKVFTQLETYPSASDPASWDHITVWVITTSTTQCLLRVFNNSGTSYSSLVVHWAAIYDGS